MTPSHTQVPAQTAAGSAPSSSLAPDTLYNAHTRAAALLAAGAAADVGTALASGTARRALAIVRPPGAQVRGRAGACCVCLLRPARVPARSVPALSRRHQCAVGHMGLQQTGICMPHSSSQWALTSAHGSIGST